MFVDEESVVKAAAADQKDVAGKVDLGLYEQNCLFADPTISFRGREKYTRNLQTLKAFFIDPTIQLFSLEELASEPLSLKAGQDNSSPYHALATPDAGSVYCCLHCNF